MIGRRSLAAIVASLAILTVGEAGLAYETWRLNHPPAAEPTPADVADMHSSLYPEEATENISAQLSGEGNQIQAAARATDTAMTLSNDAARTAAEAKATAEDARAKAESANAKLYALCQIDSLCPPG